MSVFTLTLPLSLPRKRLFVAHKAGYWQILSSSKLLSTAFQAAAGQQLVEALGRAFRGTLTALILGSVGIALRAWFLERSGLAETQVTNGALTSLVYEPAATTLSLHPGVQGD
jgi:hypothetical protein